MGSIQRACRKYEYVNKKNAALQLKCRYVWGKNVCGNVSTCVRMCCRISAKEVGNNEIK